MWKSSQSYENGSNNVEGLQKSDHSCSDAIAESKEDTTSLGQSLRELKMDMAKSQNQRYIHTTYKSITI